MGRAKEKGVFVLLCWIIALAPLATQTTMIAKADPFIPKMVAMNHGYILSNGTVEPSTLPIEHSGNLYKFTGDLANYTLEIQRNNTVLDGNGFTLRIPAYGETDEYGALKSGYPLIQITSQNNIIVENFTMTQYFTAIEVHNCSNIIIYSNRIAGGWLPTILAYSSNSSLVGNTLQGNGNYGLNIMECTRLTLAYNNISSSDQHAAVIDSLSYSNITRNNILGNPDRTQAHLGFYCFKDFSNRIYENNFINNTVGIFYVGNPGSSDNYFNNANGNYWSNYQNSIDGYGKDSVSSQDLSPLTNPASTAFNASMFQLPTFPLKSPSTADSDNSLLEAILTVAVALAAIGSALALYTKKKRRQLPNNLKSTPASSFP